MLSQVQVEKSNQKINDVIKSFPTIFPIEAEMKMTFTGISRLIMLDRYAAKDPTGETIECNDLVVLTTHDDPQYPARGIGRVIAVKQDQLTIEVETEFRTALTDLEEAATGIVTRNRFEVEKPLELYYEQIAKRVAHGIASQEKNDQEKSFKQFYHQLVNQNLIPAGRVLYGAGTDSEVTYFNCFVMPFIHDSRGGLAKHRQEVMEIMSRGGGVGTNGSTLRPHSAIVHGVNGKSSGAVSWLNDLANLTNLVEQGGSRRGAQMIMMADWHPDIFEFIISKMQNPNVLRHLIATTTSPTVKKLAQQKLSFTPLTVQERTFYQKVVTHTTELGLDDEAMIQELQRKLSDGGTYSVKEPDFLSGANISVCLTKDFMEAVEADQMYALRFPAVESYSAAEMRDYDEHWADCGDVREWERSGQKVKVYQEIKARELWDLITYCATYSAEPGIFFIDNANDMTNATAYGQKVVATNPCGEQPLTPYAVCNLAAINLANVVDRSKHEVDFEKLAEIVTTSVRFQDDVIDATPYFFAKNETQAKGERRIGLGVMGLADLLIYCEKVYGSTEGNLLVDRVFETIATTAYRTSIELAKEKGSFPFLIGKTAAETQALREKFITTGYMQKMPSEIKADILKYGIRNSHLLTVAPTGSTGTMVGVATGLEPYFSFSYFRSGRLGKFIEVNAEIVEDYLAGHPSATKETLPAYFVSAMELAPEAHVSVQCTIQRWVDSSISKTVNAPKGYQVPQVAQVYQALYRGGAKGGTVYVDGSRDSQVLTLEASENEVATPDFVSEQAPVEEVSVETIVNVSEIEDGELCPICHQGTIEEIGGCSTCTNCKVQLKCGL